MQWRYFSSRAKKRAALLIDGDICTPRLLGSFIFEAERLYHPISKKVFIPYLVQDFDGWLKASKELGVEMHRVNHHLISNKSLDTSLICEAVSMAMENDIEDPNGFDELVIATEDAQMTPLGQFMQSINTPCTILAQNKLNREIVNAFQFSFTDVHLFNMDAMTEKESSAQKLLERLSSLGYTTNRNRGLNERMLDLFLYVHNIDPGPPLKKNPDPTDVIYHKAEAAHSILSNLVSSQEECRPFPGDIYHATSIVEMYNSRESTIIPFDPDVRIFLTNVLRFCKYLGPADILSKRAIIDFMDGGHSMKLPRVRMEMENNFEILCHFLAECLLEERYLDIVFRKKEGNWRRKRKDISPFKKREIEKKIKYGKIAQVKIR